MKKIDIDIEAVTAVLTEDRPMEAWAVQCHAASNRIVQSGVLGVPCRVARGSCKGVYGQHSWVVVGMDCYDNKAQIVDPTLWSQSDEWAERLGQKVWAGSYGTGFHRPHGKGMIWTFGRPERADELGEEPMQLTPRQPWSGAALAFLGMIGPLSQKGWIQLAHHPVEGWPAGEIIDAMCESGLEAFIPIDIVGMVTDRNPSGLYLPKAER